MEPTTGWRRAAAPGENSMEDDLMYGVLPGQREDIPPQPAQARERVPRRSLTLPALLITLGAFAIALSGRYAIVAPSYGEAVGITAAFGRPLLLDHWTGRTWHLYPSDGWVPLLSEEDGQWRERELLREALKPTSDAEYEKKRLGAIAAASAARDEPGKLRQIARHLTHDHLIFTIDGFLAEGQNQ